jgi:hypothetical protein
MESIPLLIISQAVGWFLLYVTWSNTEPHESQAPAFFGIALLISSFFYHSCHGDIFCLDLERYQRALAVMSEVLVVVAIGYAYMHHAPLHDYDAGDRFVPRGPRPL